MDSLTITIKDCITAGILAVGLGGMYQRLSNKGASNEKDIRKINTVLYDEHGELRVVTYPAHDHLTVQCQGKLNTQLSYVTEGLNDLKSRMAKSEDQNAAHQKEVLSEITKLTTLISERTHKKGNDDED